MMIARTGKKSGPLRRRGAAVGGAQNLRGTLSFFLRVRGRDARQPTARSGAEGAGKRVWELAPTEATDAAEAAGVTCDTEVLRRGCRSHPRSPNERWAARAAGAAAGAGGA